MSYFDILFIILYILYPITDLPFRYLCMICNILANRREEHKKERSSSGILGSCKLKLKGILNAYDASSEKILWFKISKGIICDKEVYITDTYNTVFLRKLFIRILRIKKAKE